MPRGAFALRTALALAYPFLAHAANARGSGVLAGVALLDLSLILLLAPLLAGRAWAWACLAAITAVLAWLAPTPFATLPLLAPPVVFVGAAAWLFARTLRRGRVALVTRLAALVHDAPVEALPPRLVAYTRRLTGAWAALLGALCLVNLVLALFASPEGLLARLGHPSPLPVPGARGSLFANLLVHGVVAGFLVLEYAWRRHRFPGLPYGGLRGFLRRLATLGPAAWREIVR